MKIVFIVFSYIGENILIFLCIHIYVSWIHTYLLTYSIYPYKYGKFYFRCPPGFTGDRCQVADPCNSRPCQNGATCRSTSSAFTCDCPTGFTGVMCEMVGPACVSQPCLNGGRCQPNSDGSFSCFCIPGKTGTQNSQALVTRGH